RGWWRELGGVFSLGLRGAPSGYASLAGAARGAAGSAVGDITIEIDLATVLGKMIAVRESRAAETDRALPSARVARGRAIGSRGALDGSSPLAQSAVADVVLGAGIPVAASIAIGGRMTAAAVGETSVARARILIVADTRGTADLLALANSALADLA